MTFQSESSDEVFYDADEGILPEESSAQPDADEKQDIAPPQTQDPIKQKRRCSPCCGIPRRFPRTFALIFQVFLPLYSLIAIAMIFGYFLCRLEAPGEIHDNNMALAANRMMEQLARMNEITVTITPLLCLDTYLENVELATLVDDITHFNSQLYMVDGDYVVQQMLSSGGNFNLQNISVSNFTEMRNFISTCGIEINKMVLEFQETAFNNTILDEYVGSEVTFNWIKCPVDKTDVSSNETDLTDVVSETFALYEAGEQLKHVQERWEQDLNATYEERYAEYLSTNMSVVEAKRKALAEAYANADGFDGCVEDVMSAAWWSFTVMTTIGYGNVTPSTEGGRALVYTVGFISIIIFAGILSTAGYVITTIVDDMVSRARFTKWLKIPLVQMLIWGTLFYSFLGLIAQTAIWWKRERVDIDLSFKDAYWFSFVSATTVGFGDFFLEHEAISGSDVVMFASLILIAFALLSSFLNKLGELIKSLAKKGSEDEDGEGCKGVTFEDILKDTPIICGCGCNSK